MVEAGTARAERLVWTQGTKLEKALAVGQDLQQAVSAQQDVGEDGHGRRTWGRTGRSTISSVQPSHAVETDYR